MYYELRRGQQQGTVLIEHKPEKERKLITITSTFLRARARVRILPAAALVIATAPTAPTWDLQQGPVDDEDEAEDEDGHGEVERPVLAHHGHVVHPRLPGRDPEHAHEGPVEPEELQRRQVGEEVDPQDGVWVGGGRRPGRAGRTVRELGGAGGCEKTGVGLGAGGAANE
jgi:hypothetical protein